LARLAALAVLLAGLALGDRLVEAEVARGDAEVDGALVLIVTVGRVLTSFVAVDELLVSAKLSGRLTVVTGAG